MPQPPVDYMPLLATSQLTQLFARLIAECLQWSVCCTSYKQVIFQSTALLAHLRAAVRLCFVPAAAAAAARAAATAAAALLAIGFVAGGSSPSVSALLFSAWCTRLHLSSSCATSWLLLQDGESRRGANTVMPGQLSCFELRWHARQNCSTSSDVLHTETTAGAHCKPNIKY